MSKSRMIVSATTEVSTSYGNVAAHFQLSARLMGKKHNLSHAVGMYGGKEELSIVVDMDNVPFIVLAATAHDFAMKFKQESVYFSHNGEAFLATATGDMVRLGKECEGTLEGTIVWSKGQGYTRIIGTQYYIWTKK